jgi:succinyl-diaminopimelate desuccinylase
MLMTCGKNITIEHFETEGIVSLLAYQGKTRPETFKILLNGHLDVVPGEPEQFKPVVKDGKLYGRGVYDMKAASVILTDVFCQYVDKVPYPLGLQIVTDEESSGRHGTNYQIENGVRADFVICGECGRSSGTYEIAHECKGVLVVELEFGGTAAHGAYLWRGDNAVLAATKFAHELLKLYPVPTEEADHTTVNISSIGTSNTALTKVPDHASLRLDIRFVNEDPNFVSQESLNALIKKIDPSAKISSLYAFDAPFYTNPDDPILQKLKAAAEKVEAHKFNIVKRHATSDGRFYGNLGSQACEFGIAGEDQHSTNEHITLDAFTKYRQTMQEFLASTIDHKIKVKPTTTAVRSAA